MSFIFAHEKQRDSNIGRLSFTLKNKYFDMIVCEICYYPSRLVQVLYGSQRNCDFIPSVSLKIHKCSCTCNPSVDINLWHFEYVSNKRTFMNLNFSLSTKKVNVVGGYS